MSIPVVDVSGCLVEGWPHGSVVQQIHDAFTTVGFVFITGHGIPREMHWVGLCKSGEWTLTVSYISRGLQSFLVLIPAEKVDYAVSMYCEIWVEIILQYSLLSCYEVPRTMLCLLKKLLLRNLPCIFYRVVLSVDVSLRQFLVFGERAQHFEQPVTTHITITEKDVKFTALLNNLKNRTVSHIDHVFGEAKSFFSLPQDCKSKYSRTADSHNNGYVTLQDERLDPSKPGDLKECFNVTSLDECHYPDTEVPSLQLAVRDLFQACGKLALSLMDIMGCALKLNNGYPEDPQLFVKAHQQMNKGFDVSLTTLRLLYYPPLPPDSEIKPGQLRCGEHVDYGSITLLFQDPNGGLQVKGSSGGYIDVPYCADAVLVNLGALMQNWTSDVYLATPHRVLLPVEESDKKSVRQSLAFFCHPDNGVVVECVDGSNKYPPIRADEDCWNRLNRTYQY